MLALFREYIGGISVSLAFQDVEEELAGLPGRYAPPSGRLLLATDRQDRLLGCVALRALSATDCEMKRLFVRPQGRGLGLGRQLIEAILVAGREAGYQRIALDVLPEFKVARSLYRAFGFAPIPAYTVNPVPGAEFLGLPLDAA